MSYEENDGLSKYYNECIKIGYPDSAAKYESNPYVKQMIKKITVWTAYGVCTQCGRSDTKKHNKRSCSETYDIYGDKVLNSQ